MDIQQVAAQIAASPARPEIEACLAAVYGETDITRITDDTLPTFVRLVLPRIIRAAEQEASR